MENENGTQGKKERKNENDRKRKRRFEETKHLEKTDRGAMKEKNKRKER